MSLEVEPQLLNPAFDWEAALVQTRQHGYYFGEEALSPLGVCVLEIETEALALEAVSEVIKATRGLTVCQQLERAYFWANDSRIPVASALARQLVGAVVAADGPQAELAAWVPNEVGFQRYVGPTAGISRHRDRQACQGIGATFTSRGEAPVYMWQSRSSGNQFQGLRKLDEFTATPGSVMLVRAKGYGNGRRLIHSVEPPLTDDRVVVNLRMLAPGEPLSV